MEAVRIVGELRSVGDFSWRYGLWGSYGFVLVVFLGYSR